MAAPPGVRCERGDWFWQFHGYITEISNFKVLLNPFNLKIVLVMGFNPSLNQWSDLWTAVTLHYYTLVAWKIPYQWKLFFFCRTCVEKKCFRKLIWYLSISTTHDYEGLLRKKTLKQQWEFYLKKIEITLWFLAGSSVQAEYNSVQIIKEKLLIWEIK